MTEVTRSQQYSLYFTEELVATQPVTQDDQQQLQGMNQGGESIPREPSSPLPLPKPNLVPASPGTQKTYQNFRQSNEDLTSPQRRFGAIRRVQSTLRRDEAVRIPQTEDNPEWVIMQGEIHRVTGQAGKGTTSDVQFTVRFGAQGTPPRPQVVKKTSNPRAFRYQVGVLNALSPASKLSSKIDHIQRTASVRGLDEYLATSDASDCDLSSVKYEEFESPVAFIVPQLADMVDGMQSFHRAGRRNGLALRDIKGPNFLVNKNGPGKVTDFGLVTNVHGEGFGHETAVTTFYAPTFIWENLVMQRERRGRQTFEADTFAFGRTIQYDVIRKMLISLGKTHDIDVSGFINKGMMPKMLQGPFTDEELLAIDAKYPGRAIYYFSNARRSERVAIFPEQEQLYQQTKEAVKLFEGKLTPSEYRGLMDLTSIAKHLQTSDITQIPSLDVVKSTLVQVQKNMRRAQFQQLQRPVLSEELPQEETRIFKRRKKGNVPNHTSIADDHVASRSGQTKKRKFQVL